MKRIVLFSDLTETNSDKILNLLFPSQIKNKIFAYMPSAGAEGSERFIEEWKGYAERFGADFLVVDNASSNPEKEIEKLQRANILTISGGNTYRLLNNLRQSGLDEAIKDFSKKDEFVLSGFSAGAIVMTPTINICNLPNYDENIVGLKDLTGLGIVDFEIFAHFSPTFEKDVEEYEKIAENEVKKISDEEWILIQK